MEKQSGTIGQRRKTLKSIEAAVKLAKKMNLGNDELKRLSNEALSSLWLTDLHREQNWKIGKGILREIADGNSNRFASIASDGRSVGIYDAHDQTLLKTLVLPDGSANRKLVGGLLFSPDGNYLASACYDPRERDRVMVWDLTSSKLAGSYPIAPPIDPKFRPHIHRPYDFGAKSGALCVSSDRTVKFIRLVDGSVSHQIDRPHKLHDVRVGPDGQYVAIAGIDRVEVFDVNGSLINPYCEFSTPTPALRMAWSPDGYLAAGLRYSGRVPIWNVRKKELEQEFIGDGKRGTTSVAFHGEEPLLATQTDDGWAQLRDLNTRKIVIRFKTAMVTHFTSDGRALATRQGRVALEPSERVRLRLPEGRLPEELQYWARESNFALHPNGRLLVKGDGDNLVFWDLAHKDPLLMVKRPFGICHFSVDGDCLYCALEDGSVERLPVSIRKLDETVEIQVGPSDGLVKIERLPQSWTHAQWSYPSKRFVLASRAQSFVTVLDRATNQLHKFGFRDDGIWVRGDISSDGRFLATGWHLGGARVWDVLSGQLLWTLKTFESRARFSPDGQTLAIAEPARCQFFRRADDEGKVWELVHSTRDAVSDKAADDVEFAPDGRLVAVSGKKPRNQIDLIELPSFTKLATLQRSKNAWASQLFFSSEGRHLIASSKSQPYDLWNLESINRQLSDIGLDWGLTQNIQKSANRGFDDHPVPIRLTWQDGGIQRNKVHD